MPTHDPAHSMIDSILDDLRLWKWRFYAVSTLLSIALLCSLFGYGAWKHERQRVEMWTDEASQNIRRGTREAELAKAQGFEAGYRASSIDWLYNRNNYTFQRLPDKSIAVWKRNDHIPLEKSPPDPEDAPQLMSPLPRK